MQVSVGNQAYVFFYSVIGGGLIAFIFDIFRIKRKAIKTSNILTYIEDFLYWIIAALVMFAIVYFSNDGELRGYIFFGTVMGAALYILLLSKTVIKISLKLIRVISRILRTTWNVLSYPFRFMIKILSIPGIILFNFICKALKAARRVSRTNIAKISVKKRIFRNARKKI